MNIIELKENLNDEENGIFASLEELGCSVELEERKLVLRDYSEDGNPSYGPYETKEEIVHEARRLLQIKSGHRDDQSRSVDAAQSPENDPIHAGELHRQEADEVDLDTRLLKWLKGEGLSPIRNIHTDYGVVDFVTEDAIFETKCTLTFEKLTETATRLRSCRRVLIENDQINPDADVIILVCCTDDIEQIRAQAEGMGVEIKTFEELTQPSPPEFVESLFSEIEHIDSLYSYGEFINNNRLQNVTGDKRFTPSEQRRLNEALDACNERLTSGLPQSYTTTRPSQQSGGTLFPSDHAQPDVLVQQILPSKLSTHPSLLMRAQGLDEDYVRELETGYRAGQTFPPADVFYDGEKYWLADGNHRGAGAARAGALLDVRVHEGTLRDAILFALQANAQHGLKLTHDDKRLKAVTLLADPEWFKESDTVLSGIAGGITQQFISGTRRNLVKLTHAMIEDPDGEQSDEQYADMLDIPIGLVRIVRGLPAEEREQLTQNILGDDGRRRGADGHVRSAPTRATEQEEVEASLFTETDVTAGAAPIVPDVELMVHESNAGTDLQETTPAEEFTVTDRRRVHLDDEHASTDESFDNSARVAAEPASSGDFSVNAAESGGTPADETAKAIPTFSTGMKDAGWREIISEDSAKLGRLFYAKNPGAGLTTSKFTDPQLVIQEAARLQDEHEKKAIKKPTIEELLKGRLLSVSFVWIPGVDGVSVTVNAGGKPEDATRKLLASTDVRGFSEPVMEAITEQLKRKPSSKKSRTKSELLAAQAQKSAASRKSAGKASSKKKSASRASKASAKKGSSKSSSKKSRATASK